MSEEAAQEATQAFEERFWSIVDREGLSPVPSDMWEALERIARAAIAKALPHTEVI